MAADGALVDVCLLAAVAALQGLRLPRVDVQEDGSVVPHSDGTAAASPTAATQQTRCG